MFFADTCKKPYTRIELLERKITSFYDKEERMLAKVKDRKILRADLLPTEREVGHFYKEAGILEWKADFIAENYAAKLQMLNEFQHGKTISLYHERQKEKQR